ncbi:MAG: tetratricopeptide repeat protein, partial [Desulfobacteraceae bacterium]|nr:tetratricopeptide repeat protein [Desulfobacteraceae bacterium]
MVGFPISNSIDVGATEPANISMERFQLPSHPTNTSFRTAQVFPEMFEKTPPPAEETVKLSEKGKKKLVEQGVAQYEEGERDQAKKTFEYAKEAFPSNYAVPYYLGLIYLEEGRRSDAIAEWQQYVLMDPKSEDSMKIRKYLTLLIREEAVEYAKQAVANEAALLRSPVADNTVAVTTFENLGSENLEPLGKGMAAMLIHDLSQVPDLQVVERVKLQALLEEMNLGTSGLVDQKTIPKVGKLLKAKHVATGNIADIKEENLQIFSVVVDAEQIGSIDTLGVQGAMKEFYHLEKEIACIIIEGLGHYCSKMPGAFGKIHTKSLAALTAFSAGLDYLDQEKYDEAREEFQKALDEDPKFDLAEEALMSTPLTSMLLMTPSQMIIALSYSGASSTASGSASAGAKVAGDDDGMGVVGVTTAVVVGAATVAGAAAAIGGGGGDDSSPSPSAGQDSALNLTGDWGGTWSDSSGTDSGNISLSLIQTNTSVTGNVSITGSKCISTGTLSGTVVGNTLESVIQTGTDTASFNANCTSTSMNGTLEVTSGPCNGDTGTVSASITGGITIKW